MATVASSTCLFCKRMEELNRAHEHVMYFPIPPLVPLVCITPLHPTWVGGLKTFLVGTPKAAAFAIGYNVITTDQSSMSEFFYRIDECLPLRGFLICQVSGKSLSGSGSRGNGGVYYYHCQLVKLCKEHFRAETANKHLLSSQTS